MRLHQAALLLLACVSAAGCSMFRLHRKDNDVPTQVALSLYATPNVNPNADALPPDTPVRAMQTPDMAAVSVDTDAKEGPYLVNLTGGSKAELAKKMEALLDYLQSPGEGTRTPQASLQVLPATGTATVNGAQSKAVFHRTGTVAWPSRAAAVTGEGSAYVAGAPGGEGRGVPGVASVLTPFASVASQAQSTSQLSPSVAAAPVQGSAILSESVPAPLRAGNLGSTPDIAPHNAPALGQYADSPSGPSATSEVSTAAIVGSPISFKILQLKDDSVFLNADHDLLAQDLKKALGSTYVDDDDYVLQPGQFKYIDFKKIDRNTRYIAVLADFHDQSSATWKQVMRIEAGGYKYSLLVMLQNLDVVMTDESYHQPPRKKS